MHHKSVQRNKIQKPNPIPDFEKSTKRPAPVNFCPLT